MGFLFIFFMFIFLPQQLYLNRFATLFSVNNTPKQECKDARTTIFGHEMMGKVKAVDKCYRQFDESRQTT